MFQFVQINAKFSSQAFNTDFFVDNLIGFKGGQGLIDNEQAWGDDNHFAHGQGRRWRVVDPLQDFEGGLMLFRQKKDLVALDNPMHQKWLFAHQDGYIQGVDLGREFG
jgi:hypothetical protein